MRGARKWVLHHKSYGRRAGHLRIDGGHRFVKSSWFWHPFCGWGTWGRATCRGTWQGFGKNNPAQTQLSA